MTIQIGVGQVTGRIFINYRRDDVPGDARGIRDGLAARFGKSAVFMDVDNLLAGQRFDKELGKALDQCSVLIAVIGPRWTDLLTSRSEANERDYVREEIAAALKCDIPVIPVRAGREGSMPPLPRAEQLPEDIRDLVLHQKLDVAHERFGRDIAELIIAISAIRRGARSQPPLARIGAGMLAAALLGVALYFGPHLSGQGPGEPHVVPSSAAPPNPAAADPQSGSDSTKRGADEAAADAAAKAGDPQFASIMALLAPVSLDGDTPSPELTDEFRAAASDGVFFYAEEAVLPPEAQAALDSQAKWLLAHPRVRARIYGNADERESNARVLGAQRAKAVRDYLLGCGVPPEQIGSTTYGLDKPLAHSTDEAAWAMNRRVETKLVSVARD